MATTNDDSIKVLCLNELSWEYLNNSPDSSYVYANKAMLLAEKIDYKGGLATSLNRIGAINRILGNYDLAIQNIKRALRIEKEINNEYGIARANGQLTLLYANTGQIEKALTSSQICIDIYKKSKNLPALANAYDRQASIYKKQSKFNDALTLVYSSLHIREKLDDSTTVLSSYINLANLYLKLSNYRKSIEFNNKAISIAKEQKDYNRLGKAYTNIGNAYYHLEQYETAIEYNFKSIEIKRSLKQDKRLGVNYDNIGVSYYDLGKYEKAIKYYNMSLELKHANGTMKGLSTLYTNIGNVYFTLNEYRKAIEFYNKGLNASKKIDNKMVRMEIYNNIYNCNLLLGQLKKAVSVNGKYIALRDSIDYTYRNTVQIKENYLDEQRKSQLLEKDQIISQIKLRKKNLVIESLIIGLILLTLLFFTAWRGLVLKKKSILIEKEISELLKNQELHSINAMLEGQEGERKRIAQDLHDRLGSMLSMVKLHFKSIEDNLQAIRESSLLMYSKANNLLDEACEEVRQIANDLNSGVLNNFGLLAALNSLKDSIEATGQLKIEVFNFGFENKRIEYHMEINIYRIIQELLSNILKHSKASEVSIQLLKKETRLNIVVEDNGVGFDLIQVKKQKGMGLRNIESRVNSLNGELNIDSGKGGGTTVTIEMPLNKII
jgi:signal transduction histidine kinase